MENVSAAESDIVELGIEEGFVSNYGLQNVYGKWDLDNFYYKRPAVSNEYKFWIVLKGNNGAPYTYMCLYSNTPFELIYSSSVYLNLMTNCDDSTYGFSRECGMSCSSDGINWTEYDWSGSLSSMAKYKSGKGYIYYYNFCESNYYIFHGSEGNNWNNNSFVYAQPPYIRLDNEWNLAEILNSLGIPMPSYYKKGYDYLLYKTGDIYVLECIQEDDFTCYMEYIANSNDTLGQGLATRIAPFFSSPDGVIAHRVCLYYKDGAWSTYADDNLLRYDSADPVAQDTIGVDYNVSEDTYDSNWVLYSDFNLYRGGYNSAGEVLADYGVPYVMYDVESGSYIEGSTPPEGGGTGGGSQIPDSSEDDSEDDSTTETEKDPVSSELEEVNKTNKGIFAAITDFFGSFFDNLMKSIAGLFLPEDGFFEEWFSNLNDFFSEKLGFLYVPIDILIEFLTEFLNAKPGKASISLPEFAWEGTVIIGAQNVPLNFDAVPGLQDKIYFVTDVLMIGNIFQLLQNKLKEMFKS